MPEAQPTEADHYLQPYLDEYYGSLTEENLEIGRFLLEATALPAGIGPTCALDVGCGPTLLYWGLFMHPCDVHNGMDALDTNLDAVRREVFASRNGEVHARYAEICEYLEPGAGTGRFHALCDRVGRLEAVDAAGAWPFPDASMNLVTAIFSVEVLPTLGALQHALSEARRVMVDGGRMVVVSLCETTQWKIGDYTGSCLALTPETLIAALAAAGFTNVRAERKVAGTAITRDQGYQWMLFVSADAGPDVAS